MKIAKVMLLAIAVFAAVGGALAFKVGKIGNKRFCYITTNVEPQVGDCLKTIINRAERAKLPTDPTVFYTTTNDVTLCSLATCPNIGILDQQ